MDRTTGIVIAGAIGLMLVSLTLVDQQQWVNDWLPTEIAEEVARIGSTLRAEQGKQLGVIPPARMRWVNPGNRGLEPEQTSGDRLGISGE
jgi:hypothetical protein